VGRLARVLVEIDDPLGLDRPAGAEGAAPLPMLLGAFVHVEIPAGSIAGAVAIPRAQVHDDDRVWIMGEGDRLAIRRVDVSWRARDHVIVRSGVVAGERIVTSPIANPVEGMLLRVAAAPPHASPANGPNAPRAAASAPPAPATPPGASR
jgi:multidrug efflux pump subunit AcrA (membrane-fusion protein)